MFRCSHVKHIWWEAFASSRLIVICFAVFYVLIQLLFKFIKMKRQLEATTYIMSAFFPPFSVPSFLLALQQNSITLILPYNHFSSPRLDSFPGLTEKSLITLWPWLPLPHFPSHSLRLIPPKQPVRLSHLYFRKKNTQTPVKTCEPRSIWQSDMYTFALLARRPAATVAQTQTHKRETNFIPAVVISLAGLTIKAFHFWS